MIILDTDIVSELMRADDAAPEVAAWLRGCAEPVVTTIVTRAEILSGIALLRPGRRCDDLHARAVAAFDMLGDCLPLNASAAASYAEIVAVHRRSDRSCHEFDELVAAIARQARATLATRNLPAFEGLGIELVNPWEEAAG